MNDKCPLCGISVNEDRRETCEVLMYADSLTDGRESVLNLVHVHCVRAMIEAAKDGDLRSRFARLAIDNATTNAALREVMEFVRDVATNYDHDSDAHRYGTPCRECGAQKLLGIA